MAASLVEQAERALLLSEFSSAEQHARQAAKQASGQEDERQLQDRACVVALQTLAETQRFGLAHRLLCNLFGSVGAAPPNTALLWLALALDTDSRRQAERLIFELIEKCQPSGPDGSANGWSRRQYLALLHLYTLEVLLPEMREPAAVMRWIQNTPLPINAEERQLLCSELELEQPPPVRSPGNIIGGSSTAADGESRDGAARAGTWKAEEQAVGIQERQKYSRQAAVQPPAVRSAAAVAAAAAAVSEIEPAYLHECSAGGAAGVAQVLPLSLDWLGRCQQQLVQGAAAILRPLLGTQAEEWRQRLHAALGAPIPSTTITPSTAEKGKSASTAGTASTAVVSASEPDTAAPLRQLTSTVLGCALLYAAYAERRAIRQGVGRARHFVAGGVADLLRMALNLSINPLAA